MSGLSRHERRKFKKLEKEARTIKQARSSSKRKLFKRFLMAFGLIVIVLLAYKAIVIQSSKPGVYDEFAQCLAEAGAVEYGAFWCPNCANQKALFGKSFKFINYIECDARGDNADPQACQEAGIEGYPTWIINGQSYTGTQSLERLSAISGCELS